MILRSTISTRINPCANKVLDLTTTNQNPEDLSNLDIKVLQPTMLGPDLALTFDTNQSCVSSAMTINCGLPSSTFHLNQRQGVASGIN